VGDKALLRQENESWFHDFCVQKLRVDPNELSLFIRVPHAVLSEPLIELLDSLVGDLV
jgi:hypothetical protein